MRRSRGNIRKRGQDSWTVTVTLPPDPQTGKQRRVFETVKGTKRDAERRLTELLSQLDSGLPVNSKKMLLRDYLETWLVNVVAVRNALRTHDAYSTIVHRHIVPALGNLSLTKVTPSDVERMEADLLSIGLSKNTVHHVHVVLSKALSDAMRKGILHFNVCKMIDPPSPGRYEVNLPETDAIKKILDAAWSTPYGMLFHLIAFTGLRRGEAVALQWEHVDLERGVVSIVQTAQRLGRQGIIIQPPKSASGRRGIALDETTIDLLREHRGKQLLYKVELEGAFEDNGYVFPNPFGRILDPSVATRNFERIRNKLSYARIRLHDLRHFHAGGMVKANVHPRVIQERLGHASAAFTMQVYGHVAAGLQEQAAKDYAAMMSKSSSDTFSKT